MCRKGKCQLKVLKSLTLCFQRNPVRTWYSCLPVFRGILPCNFIPGKREKPTAESHLCCARSGLQWYSGTFPVPICLTLVCHIFFRQSTCPGKTRIIIVSRKSLFAVDFFTFERYNKQCLMGERSAKSKDEGGYCDSLFRRQLCF